MIMSRVRSSGKSKNLKGSVKSEKLTKRVRKEPESLWAFIKFVFLKIKPYLLLTLLYLSIHARVHPDNEKEPLRKFIRWFLYLFIDLFTKLFHDDGVGMVLGGVIGLAVFINLFHLILGWENFKENWGYFFSSKVRKKIKRKAKGDRLYLYFVRVNAFGLILVTIVLPLFMCVGVLVLR